MSIPQSPFTRQLWRSTLRLKSIYIITDNTRYYLSKKLREWVEGTKIKQIFLPPILRI